MKEYAQDLQSSELSLVAVPTTSGNSAAGSGPAAAAGDTAAVTSGTDSEYASTAATEDRYFAKAAKEYAAGDLDPSLWARAVDRAGGDSALATRTYLDSRATALRVAKRNESSARRASVAEAFNSAPDPSSVAEESQAPDDTKSKEAPRTRHDRAGLDRTPMIIVAGVLASVVVATGFIALWPDTVPAQATTLVTPALPVDVSGRSISLQPPTSATTNKGGPPREGRTAEEIVSDIQALEKAGNWNLLVIYSSELTRKQPENAVAWKELSRGYVKLRQFGEALDAATKAATLAPEDFLVWQNLGQLNLALQRPAEALSAFERAVALNDGDVVSLVQEGILNTQLGRLSDARIAFAKALALSPENAEALCGAVSLARKEGRVKDAEAMTRQATSFDGGCRDPGAVESVRVAAKDAAQNRSKSQPVRRLP